MPDHQLFDLHGRADGFPQVLQFDFNSLDGIFPIDFPQPLTTFLCDEIPPGGHEAVGHHEPSRRKFSRRLQAGALGGCGFPV